MQQVGKRKIQVKPEWAWAASMLTGMATARADIEQKMTSFGRRLMVTELSKLRKTMSDVEFTQSTEAFRAAIESKLAKAVQETNLLLAMHDARRGCGKQAKIAVAKTKTKQ